MPTKKTTSDLPYNSQAEKAVLGSAMVSKEALYNVLTALYEEDFFEGKHQLIFRAIKSLFDRKIDVDVLTVSEELENYKELENIGGSEYLGSCTESIVTLSNIEFYIDIVLNQSVLRKLIIAVRKIDDKYKTDDIEDVNDFILKSDESIKDAISRRKIDTFKKTDVVAGVVEKEINAPHEVNEDNIIGLPSGYPKIDKLTQGFQKGGMYIVAARPSVGKTALALNFAYHAAVHQNKAVAIFSLEMDAETLVKRLIGSVSYIPLQKVASGNLTGNERMKVMSAIKDISKAPIYIDDSSNLKLVDVLAKAQKLQQNEPNLGLIIIDYLGLVTTGSNAKNPDSRQEEVRKISLALKGLARDLNLPVIVVSQLSRDVEKRGDNKRPMLSDLRDSGNIEQDADVVMLLYREDYYKNSKAPGSSNPGNKKMSELSNSEKLELMKEAHQKNGDNQLNDTSYVEVNVAKNRNGQTGIAGLFFYKNFGRFDSPSKEWEEQMAKMSEEINAN